MSRLALVIVVTLAAAAGVFSPRAGAQQAPQLNITRVDATAYPTITAVVTALDGSGFPAAADGFAGFEDASPGQSSPLEVTQVNPERLALGVVIVIDVSGSMRGAPLEAAKQAALDFVDNLGEQDSAALIAFSTQVREVAPFTSDRASLAAGISSLQAEADTSLFEAAQRATQVAASSGAPRKAIVLLTDGENATPSPVTRGQAVAAADAADIPVYGVGFSAPPAQPDASFLQELAQATNGLYRPAETGTVRTVYGEISRLLDSQYTLTLAAPESGLPAGASTLRIRANVGGSDAEASFRFERPAPAVVPATAAPPADPSAQADEEDGGGPSPALVAGSIVGVMMLAVLAVFAYSTVQRGRTRRRQEAVVAPNRESARTKPLPQRGSTIIVGDDGAGRLVAIDGESPGAAWDFASTPLRIGTAPYCEVRVEAARDVAPQHAMVWMKDRKIMLRHVAGPRRTTMVNGRPVDWVILDEGDVVTIGPHRYRAEPREE